MRWQCGSICTTNIPLRTLYFWNLYRRTSDLMMDLAVLVRTARRKAALLVAVSRCASVFEKVELGNFEAGKAAERCGRKPAQTKGELGSDYRR